MQANSTRRTNTSREKPVVVMADKAPELARFVLVVRLVLLVGVCAATEEETRVEDNEEGWWRAGGAGHLCAGCPTTLHKRTSAKFANNGTNLGCISLTISP